MWLWESELHQLGVRRLSAKYWKCERRYGLSDGTYLSIFPDARERLPNTTRERLEICAFHVTFCFGVDHIHFYYHEVQDGIWETGGHTSSGEIRRYHPTPSELIAQADAIAGAFLNAIGVRLIPRDES